MMLNIFNNLTTAFDVYTIIWILISNAILYFGFFRFFFLKERRLFKNRKRPIMVFKSKEQSMDTETKLLRDSKFFNIPEDPTDNHKNTDRIKNHGLIIVGYSKGMNGFQEILSAAKSKQIPIIIYATSDVIDRNGNDYKEICKYSYQSICNFPLRLVNDVFTILSTFPHGK